MGSVAGKICLPREHEIVDCRRIFGSGVCYDRLLAGLVVVHGAAINLPWDVAETIYHPTPSYSWDDLIEDFRAPIPEEFDISPSRIYGEPIGASIVRLAAKINGLTLAEIRSDRRMSKITRARQLVYYAAKKHTTKSLHQIASLVGRMDHTTVIKGARRAERMMESDPSFRSEYEFIQKQLFPETNGVAA